MLLLIASQQSQLHALLAAMVFGLLLGIFGHVIRSRTLIVTGILIIGLVSAYFAWVVQPH